MRDSETPDQPKRAKAKATMSVGEVGGVVSDGLLAEMKKVGGMREIMCCIDGSGYIMFSRSGRSAAMALRERYRSKSSAELFVRLAIGM